jgi:hypothetical protein
VGSLLIWLSGAQPEILAQFQHDRAKYVGIGSAVLITSTMAVVSMSFALHMALNASLPLAIPFALAWGLAIMSLDRWLVVSLARQPGFGYLLLALPRALLGLLFGIIISTPLTLQIFHVEIENQMSIDHTNASAAYNSSPAVAKLTASVTADQQAVAKYQAVINSNGGAGMSPAQDPTLVSLNKQFTSDQSQAQSYYKAWHCEVYGGCGPTYVVGDGKAAQTDYANYQHYTSLATTDQQQIAAEQSNLNQQNATNAASTVSSARGDMIPAQAKLTRDESALTTLKQNYRTTLASDTGILARLQALDELRMSNPTLFVAEFLLFLFFTAIEWLPIMVKLLLNFGPENTYEQALAEAEQVSLMRAENERMTQYLRSVREQNEMHTESERVYNEWTYRVLPGLIRDELNAKERIARHHLEQWEQHALADPSRNAYAEGLFAPGGFSMTSGKRPPEWTYRQVRLKPMQQRRSKLRMRPRLAAAWQGFRLAGHTGLRATGPIRITGPIHTTAPIRITGPIPRTPGQWPNG